MEIPYIVTPRKDTGLFNSKIAIWLFLASEVMLFGGFFSAYIFLRLGADFPWPERTLPVLPGLINTFVLIASSVTVVFAWASLKMRQWGKFQLYMAITVICSFIFMGLKGIEYNVKFHHQALRTKDYSVVEGHLGYLLKPGVHAAHGGEEQKEEDFARDHHDKKIEENTINFEAAQITFNTVRYYKPWVEALMARAGEEYNTVVFAKAVVLGVEASAATTLENQIDQLKEDESLPALPDGAKAFRKGDEITAAGLERLVEGWKDTPHEARAKQVSEGLIAGAVMKPASITLAEKLELQSSRGNPVVFEKGTKLDVKLLDDIKKAHLAARANNSELRVDSLRDAWDKEKEANPGKRSSELAPNVKIDESAIAEYMMPEAAAIAFEVSPATVFRFGPRDIQEGAAAGTLRDGTALAGKLLESPMGFHYVDALDFRHLAMKVTEKIGRHDEAAIEKAIEESWLLKENHELAEIWEKQQAALAKLRDFLATKGKVPTEKDKYRINWQEMAFYADPAYSLDSYDPSKTFAMPKVDENGKEKFFGPDYHTRKFPHLEVPRDQVLFASKFEPAWNTYYAIYFTMTGLHGLHVIGGAIVLAYYLFCGKKMYLSNPEWLANRVEVGGLFWHFVDLVWIFLFPILYLM